MAVTPSKRLSNVPVSAPLMVDLAAKELIAAGRNVVSFCVGEPDVTAPLCAREAGSSAILEGRTKYTNASGCPQLKAALCDTLNRDYGTALQPKEISVTTGAKYAVYAAVNAVCDPGEEVILPAPYWTSYYHLTVLSGAVPVVVPCTEENGFKLTPAQLEAAVTPRTRAVILNNPNNPTGAVYTREELFALAECTARHGLFLLADEIYSTLTYGVPFTSVLSLPDALRERIILINGVSKTYAMTGYRIGYTAAPAPIAAAINAMLSHTTGSPCTASQEASIAALLYAEKEPIEMQLLFSRRCDVICREAEAIGLRFAKPQGAFYLFADIRPYLGKTYPDDLSFALSLLKEEGVAAVPCTEFGAPGFLRLSFTLPEEEIIEGLQRIRSFLEKGGFYG